LSLTVGYVASGKLALLLAVPPGYASPIFPPAGIAIAAMLIGGPATLPWTNARAERKSGSHATHRWREPDSNPRSPV
jgi:hypothetical protein